MRYLVNSYSWEQLLKKICLDLKGNDEFFYDLKEMYYIDGNYKELSIEELMPYQFNEGNLK